VGRSRKAWSVDRGMGSGRVRSVVVYLYSLARYASVTRLGLKVGVCGLAAGLAFLAPVGAKQPALEGIELFRGAGEPGYVLIANLLINGKDEVRGCGTAAKIDKSAYGKLPKIMLSSGMAIEYGSDGVLRLETEKESSCVVPGNVKFEKSGPMSPAELAAHSSFVAQVIGGSVKAPSLPAWGPGVKIVLVAEPTAELGEFLLADREATIPLWQGFIAKYPASEHSKQAKQALVSLLLSDGKTRLEAYEASQKAARSYEDLKNARMRAEQVIAVIPGDPDGIDLGNKVQGQIAELLGEGRTELEKYKQALAAHTSGYAHLVTAEEFAKICLDVDPRSSTALAFQTDTNHEANALESSLRAAESLVASKRFDDALAGIKAYEPFAPEVPRVAAIVDSAYRFHMDRAREMGTAQNWEGAVEEYRKASAVKNTGDVTTALNDSEKAWQTQKDKQAADEGRQKSATFVQNKQYIDAYEVLLNLPPQQRALVTDDMHALEPMYIKQASDTAKDIEKAHDPIAGLKDEEAIEQAYGYLERAYELGNDASLKDRMDDLGDKLSVYYLAEAKRYLNKPLGTGAGVGWSYLEKALRYKASNLDAVRDERTKASDAYQMRSRLSIRVEFRDQTSRRDSAGFADQLTDSIATGLETSGLPVKVIRPNETPSFEPNFQLIGDVLQHGHTTGSTSTPKQSHYRAGEEAAPTEEWNKANREHEAATLELQTAQQALEGAMAHHKGNEIKEAKSSVAAATKKVEDASVKLDSIPATLPVDVIKPYTYTEKQVELGAFVELRFQIFDFSKNLVGDTVAVKKTDHAEYSFLENVKPDDTDGVKEQGSIPDELQIFTNVEDAARDQLVSSVKDAVAKLPIAIIEEARRRVRDADTGGAAELYILYLNSTPNEDTLERREAAQFLLEEFNIRQGLNAGGS